MSSNPKPTVNRRRFLKRTGSALASASVLPLCRILGITAIKLSAGSAVRQAGTADIKRNMTSVKAITINAFGLMIPPWRAVMRFDS